jgi:hypothetical protein
MRPTLLRYKLIYFTSSKDESELTFFFSNNSLNLLPNPSLIMERAGAKFSTNDLANCAPVLLSPYTTTSPS